VLRKIGRRDFIKIVTTEGFEGGFVVEGK